MNVDPIITVELSESNWRMVLRELRARLEYGHPEDGQRLIAIATFIRDRCEGKGKP